MLMCGDVDGNMTVDAADLGLLLNLIFAGTPVANECIGDVDGSGILMRHIADPGRYPLNCVCGG